MKQILKTLYQNSKNKYLIFNTLDKNYLVRMMHVANNPNTPISILEFLSNDKKPPVRSSIAYNPKATIHILEKLSNDENVYVRASVASNKRTPISILEKLSNDKDLLVWEYVYKNPNWIKSRKL